MNRDSSTLKETLFDILIIGGGINGAGIARDAALRGFKVCLVEKGDFGSGTSSKSSKLVHGGLRYLEHGHFKLVYEALKERQNLLKIAPHLVHPLSFLLPVYKNDARGSFLIKLGLSLYDSLAGKRKIKPHEKIQREELLQEVPKLKDEGLKKGFHFYDAQMNDARMTLENILSAIQYGAQCFNYVKVTGLIEKESKICGALVEDVISGQKNEIQSKLVINATGPWVDQLISTHRQKTPVKLRLTKGIHIVLPRLSGHHALLLSTQKDNRVFFCIPWGEYSLVGTTDTDFVGDPDHVRAESEDVKYLLEAIQRLFPESKIGPENVISTFAGLRPLIRQTELSTSQVSREYKIEETFSGMISILGGKYTTYRSLAEHVVNQAAKTLHLHEDQPCKTATLPLPGGEFPQTPRDLAHEFNFDLESAQHLIKIYGSRASQVAKISKEFGMKVKLCPHHSHLKAEVLHAFTNEMAQNLEDFLTRRTFIRYSRCRGLDCLETVAKILLELSIFSEEELEEQKAFYRERVRADLSALTPS